MYDVCDRNWLDEWYIERQRILRRKFVIGNLFGQRQLIHPEDLISNSNRRFSIHYRNEHSFKPGYIPLEKILEKSLKRNRIDPTDRKAVEKFALSLVHEFFVTLWSMFMKKNYIFRFPMRKLLYFFVAKDKEGKGYDIKTRSCDIVPYHFAITVRDTPEYGRYTLEDKGDWLKYGYIHGIINKSRWGTNVKPYYMFVSNKFKKMFRKAIVEEGREFLPHQAYYDYIKEKIPYTHDILSNPVPINEKYVL